MKEKIIARLKVKFAGVNLSKKRMDAIADKLAKKIEKEEEIDDALDEANELMDFADIAKQDDRVRTLEAEAKKPKPANEPSKDNPDDKPGVPKPVEEVPSWAKGLVEANQTLLKEITQLKVGKTAENRRTVLETKLKDVNSKLREKILKDFGKMQFENDEDFNSYVEETVTDLGEFVQGEAESRMASFGTPPMRPAGKKGDAEVSPMMKQIINERKASAQPAKA